MRNHPLFPGADGKDGPDVHQINVTRQDAPGKATWYPETIPSENLASLADLFSAFGGGEYELIGRDAKHIVARVRYSVAGPSKRLVPEAEPPPPQATPPAAAPGFGGVDGGVMMMMLKMMHEQSLQSMQMMTTLMASRGGDSDRVIQMMQANNEAALKGQGEVFRAMLAATQSGGAGQFDQLMNAVKMGVELAGGDEVPEESGFDTALEAGNSAVEMLERMATLAKKKEAAPAPAQPEPTAPPNGRAAPRMTAPAQPAREGSPHELRAE